jgi:ketosteroid isomerase-like protein
LLETPEHAVRAYAAAFETLDPTAVATFYHPPCLFVSPTAVAPVPDAAAATAMAAFLVHQAKAQSYRRSVISSLNTTILGPGLASATGSFVRLGPEDQEIMRFGFLYLLRQVEGRWLISVAVAHPPHSEP